MHDRAVKARIDIAVLEALSCNTPDLLRSLLSRKLFQNVPNKS